jgi:hypothetical protein
VIKHHSHQLLKCRREDLPPPPQKKKTKQKPLKRTKNGKKRNSLQQNVTDYKTIDLDKKWIERARNYKRN